MKFFKRKKTKNREEMPFTINLMTIGVMAGLIIGYQLNNVGMWIGILAGAGFVIGIPLDIRHFKKYQEELKKQSGDVQQEQKK